MVDRMPAAEGPEGLFTQILPISTLPAMGNQNQDLQKPTLPH